MLPRCTTEPIEWKGLKMVLLNPVDEVLNILKISGFDKLLTIMYDYEEARKLLTQS